MVSYYDDMSETLKKIERYKWELLWELYNSCTDEQQELFRRMHKGTVTTPFCGISVNDTDKYVSCVKVLERTIDKNNKNGTTKRLVRERSINSIIE